MCNVQPQWNVAVLLMVIGVAAGIDSVYFSWSSELSLRALVLIFGVLSFALGLSFSWTTS
jgi:hypothetical protein